MVDSPAPDGTVTLVLPLPMVRLLLQSLAELPFRVAADPINLIQQQATAQMRATAAPPPNPTGAT